MQEAGKLFAEPADCTVCGRGFGAHIVAEAHALAHAGWVACSDCGETMPAAEYGLHKRRRHTRRGYECHCGAAFYTQTKLDDHVRDTHAGPWYRCGRCLKLFRNWKAFKLHTKAAAGACKLVNPAYAEDPEVESNSEPCSEHTSMLQERQQPVSSTSCRSAADGDPEVLHAHRPSARRQ